MLNDMQPDEHQAHGGPAVRLTRIGLGTAPLGGLYQPVDRDEALETVRRALASGIRYIDTAPLYGHGLAEQRTGAALEGVPRDSYTLSTKVGRLLRTDAAPPPPERAMFRGTPPANPVFDYSRDGVLRSIDESLERLGVGRIDVALVHDPDDHFEEAVDGAFPALVDLRDQGVIAAVGAGMNQSRMLTRFVQEVDLDVVLVAGRYTLLDQRAAHDLFPACEQGGVRVIVGGVYNSGVLARPTADATYDYAPAPDHVIARARRLAEVLAPHDVPLMAAALQFPMAHPAVESVLIGPRSVAELEQNLELARFPVPPEAWEDLRAAGLLDGQAPVPGPP